MKIVFLNALNAQFAGPLREFLEAHRDTTDVFCFQEAGDAMRALVAPVLPGYARIAASKPLSAKSTLFENVTLVRHEHIIESSNSNSATEGLGLTLFVSVRYRGKLVRIANTHGLSRPGKLDAPARLQQSQEIIDILHAQHGATVIGGDFNVLPETQSIRMFEEAGYKNLIKDFGIKTTRNRIAWDRHPGNELYYSDYVFVREAGVLSFSVPDGIISDHQPMVLDLDL